MARAMAAPRNPTNAPFEHERPADEGVGRADEAHDLDLLGPRDDREADRVDDDEQRDDADHEEQDGARGPQDVGDGQDALDQVLDVDDVADLRLIAQGVGHDRHAGRVRQLDLQAGVQRVAVQVAGQVLATLGLHRFAEVHERLFAADVGDGFHLGQPSRGGSASRAIWPSGMLGWR